MLPHQNSNNEVEESATRGDLEDDVLDQNVPAPKAVIDNERTPGSSSSNEDRVWRKTSKVKFDKPCEISRSTHLDLNNPVQIFLQVLRIDGGDLYTIEMGPQLNRINYAGAKLDWINKGKFC
ncbi:hypothetical protein ILUMI_13476 [Ignelater luminosus]|uniref:Uncharacterized protein n=1 Tax=Ignelater luminosus TaxID=2038154 RepID=A0A8K0CWN6_IGNLU|nr:hypothetical protein ILUMI_13476 [Ignelater luminosus]